MPHQTDCMKTFHTISLVLVVLPASAVHAIFNLILKETFLN
jgi:hypothetical protein